MTQQAMILGAVWCPVEKAHEIDVRIREIKTHYQLNPRMEIKWTKVSTGGWRFYMDVMDYFFDDDHLHPDYP